MPAEFWGGVSIICVFTITVLVWLLVHQRNRNPNAFRFRDPLTVEERVVLTEAVYKHRREQREQDLKYINGLLSGDKGWELLSDAQIGEVRSAFAASMQRRYDW